MERDWLVTGLERAGKPDAATPSVGRYPMMWRPKRAGKTRRPETTFPHGNDHATGDHPTAVAAGLACRDESTHSLNS